MKPSSARLAVLWTALVMVTVQLASLAPARRLSVGLGAPLCARADGGDLRLASCDADTVGDNETRQAMGVPLCWWTADRMDLQGVDGVGAATAERLIVAREAGLVPSESGWSVVRGVGSVLEARLDAALTEACPGRARVDERSGSSHVEGER